MKLFMGEFGVVLKKIIKFSGVKNAVVAQRINFDPSYVSKWINSDLLPSSRVVELVCLESTNLLIENIDGDELETVCKLIGAEYEQYEEISVTKQKIYDSLYHAYQHDYEKKVPLQTTGERTKVPYWERGRDRREILFKHLNEYRKTTDKIAISILGELLSCSSEDIIFLMDIKNEVEKLKFKTVTFNVFVSEDSIKKRPNMDTSIAFLNFVMLPLVGDVKYYNVKLSNGGLIVWVENLLIYYAQLYCKNQWRWQHFSFEKHEINYFSDMIKETVFTIARNMFSICESQIDENAVKMQQMFSERENNILLSRIDMNFIPPHILTALLENMGIYGEEMISYCIKKQQLNKERLDGDEIFRFVIFREAFEELVYNGKVRVVGKELVVPIEVRFAILDYINILMSTYPNLRIKIIDTYLVNEIKHVSIPSFYLSQKKGFFLMFQENDLQKFCTIKDKYYQKNLLETFENIWNENMVQLLEGTDIICEYLDISSKMLYFELM